MPANDLLFWPVGIRDGFVMNSVLADRIFGWFLHGCFADSIRRTEVRPISRRRAISALLIPAR
jgi:hypothetical protein